MTNEKMTDEERAIWDKLNSYYKENKNVHILLKKVNNKGENIFLNGELLFPATERVWVLKERKLGEIRIAISEIKFVEEERDGRFS